MNGVEPSSAAGSIAEAWSSQWPEGATPAPGSIDQKHPLVNPDLEWKGNATMTTNTDTGVTSPNPGLARPASHRDLVASNCASYRDAFAVFVSAIPEDRVLRSFEAALHAVYSTATCFGHTDTARPLSCDVERAAADRSVNRCRLASRASTCEQPRERRVADGEYIRRVGERICEIVSADVSYCPGFS
jgi:hypothetical protein